MKKNFRVKVTYTDYLHISASSEEEALQRAKKAVLQMLVEDESLFKEFAKARLATQNEP